MLIFWYEIMHNMCYIPHTLRVGRVAQAKPSNGEVANELGWLVHELSYR